MCDSCQFDLCWSQLAQVVVLYYNGTATLLAADYCLQTQLLSQPRLIIIMDWFCGLLFGGNLSVGNVIEIVVAGDSRDVIRGLNHVCNLLNSVDTFVFFM